MASAFSVLPVNSNFINNSQNIHFGQSNICSTPKYTGRTYLTTRSIEFALLRRSISFDLTHPTEQKRFLDLDAFYSALSSRSYRICVVSIEKLSRALCCVVFHRNIPICKWNSKELPKAQAQCDTLFWLSR